MLETERLRLRQWQPSDQEAYIAINADENVMRFFPATMNREETLAQIGRAHAYIEKHGWGFWAVELKATNEFIGFVGLLGQDAQSGLPNAPMVEVGWRLSSKHWGEGYAPEAAKAALEFAFTQLNLSEVYSFTAIQNAPSRRVMEKIGMHNTEQNFDHPKLPKGHQLERHCLYRMTASQWRALQPV
ncbi:GNAT family N-acetyltransferase [Vibrio sp. RE86]|uniref:GNAT family N-acetyltransferase n=1 Tax=Vibrio sp. RE86 TaxID=2607605 RepID=UPI001493D30B|nr:GNAT family N-acetyltransferase [Vibrio sp. RE86]NOH80502.1 GNAT family N-acetyltransferase [Vibrio sp. RE86]